jgi:ankyrin repeat protein
MIARDDIDSNTRDDSGRTPLAHVCQRYSCGSLAIVRSLLSHPGTDPNAVDDNGISIFVGFRTRQS